MLVRLALGLLAAALVVGSLGGCSSLGFYQQAVVGQFRLLKARKDVDKLLAQADLAPDLRAALLDSQAVLAFAESELGLEAEGRYGAYVELQADFVVWNLVVAPVDSVTPRSWCFPVAGCVSYRGYFAKQRAQSNADRVNSEDYDTYIGGVPAYSTLGWFDDPLLSSFIHWPRPARAELLFHELAHGRLYAPGDTSFNESFATFVANHALPKFLALPDEEAPVAELSLHEQGAGLHAAKTLVAHYERRRETARFNNLLLQLRERLAADFEALPLSLSEAVAVSGANLRADHVGNRRAKVLALRARRYSEAQACFAAVADEFQTDRFSGFFAQPPNLARLSLVSAYNVWVGAFGALFAAQGDDLERFFAAAEALAELSDEARLAELERLSEQHKETQSDHQYANDIECEALTNHAADGDLAG